MTDGELPGAPWKAIEELVRRSPARRSYDDHPSRQVLQSYLRDALPQRPERWSEQRAETLAEGDISDWTMAEVAAHLSTCPHCKRGLKKRELQRSPVRADLRYTLSTALRRPRVVVVGWALAGIQAGVIIAFVVWTSMMPTRLPGFNVPMYNDVNQSQLQHTVQVLDIVQIELAAKAQMGDVIGLLERLDLQLAGPDSRDRFLLKKADGLYLSRRDVAVIEQLQAHPDLLRLILPSSDSSGEASGGR